MSNIIKDIATLLASWSSNNAFAPGAGGLSLQSRLGQNKLNTMLPTARHRCDISLK